MKEHPIIFSTETVQAILADRKTQTRRVMKTQPHQNAKMFTDNPTDDLYYWTCEHGSIAAGGIKCPFGKIGDVLWVREKHALYQTVNYIRRPDGRSFSEVSDGQVAYYADGYGSIQDLKDHIRLMSGADFESVHVKNDRWRPSIFLPKWATRIWLEITEIRVQKLQDISEKDLIAEGLLMPNFDPDHDGYYPDPWEVFADKWDNLNAKRGYPWESNPWCWTISFKRIER